MLQLPETGRYRETARCVCVVGGRGGSVNRINSVNIMELKNLINSSSWELESEVSVSTCHDRIVEAMFVTGFARPQVAEVAESCRNDKKGSRLY